MPNKENYELCPGDIVRLKSGSQSMTVESVHIPQYGTRPKAYCVWFDRTVEKRGDFYLTSLLKVDA